MDTLSWLNLNPNIQIEPTRKAFHGKYLYRVKLFAPGFRMARNLSSQSEGAIQIAINQCLQKDKWPMLTNYLKVADAGQLARLHQKLASEVGISVRIENPNVTIYSNSDTQLLDIVSTTVSADRVKTISAPAPGCAPDLMRDVVFMSTDNGYKYKAVTKEGSLPEATRLQILSYLKNLGNEVKFSKGFSDTLGQNFNWLPRSQIYLNDEHILMFIRMIAPNFIVKLYEVKVVP